MPYVRTQPQRLTAIARERGKTHCVFSRGRWVASTPDGYIGWGANPSDAAADAGARSFVKSHSRERSLPPTDLMFGLTDRACDVFGAVRH